MEKERFSLLLLEPNEIYFEDFSVNLIDENISEQIDESPRNGHLKMCSKSIVFDPKDVSDPIIKIAYKNCDNIYVWPGKLDRVETNVLAISCTQYTEMLPKNVVAPYAFKLEKRLFLFNMHYARVDEYIHQLCQLHRASSLHACEQNDMIATIVFSRHKRVKFDPLWLEDIYETVLTENTVDEINPLVLNPGRLLLTTKRIYFQPYNNIQPYPVIKIKLESISSIIKRRFLLRHTSLELKWTENDKDRILYVSFRNQPERDSFYKRTMAEERLHITQTEPESMTLKWQNGVITNYSYLLYLNSLADRTFQDLTQYPVFPWVISDYTSDELDVSNPNSYRDLTKPVGALNPDRLEKLKARYEEMEEPKFLYGSHFSAPGLVLFYLVRRHPKLMLCLQNGHFDHPDRMFNRVSDVFNNCLNNMSDFKELIPEFYDPTEDGDFLLNSSRINFGKRHDGTPVNNVILPPWAKNSPEIFISTLREALESHYVSQNLHHWIDLIFGYKQRGEEARKSDNLFFHLCYEGSVNLDNINDLAKRHALEVQISEFGQIPKQLFDKPHVPKNTNTSPYSRRLSHNNFRIDSINNVDEARVENIFDGYLANDFNNLVFDSRYQSHKDLISCVICDIECKAIISTGKDALLKCYNFVEKRQMRSVPVGSMPISSCIKISNSNLIIIGSWDNSIITYNLDYGRISHEIPAHDDAVSCISLIEDLSILISGSWDCSIKMWKGFNKSSSNNSFNLSESMVAYLSLEDKINAIDSISTANTINIAIGLANGEVFIWHLEIDAPIYWQRIEPIGSKLILTHNDEVTGVNFNESGSKIVSCGLDKFLYVCDVETGMILFKKEHANSLICMNWSFFDEILYLGDNQGVIHVWNMTDGEKKCTANAFNGPITSITSTIYDSKRMVIAAGVDFNEFVVKSLITAE